MIRKTLLYLMFIAQISLSVYAQNPIAQKYSAEINPKITRNHLSILASDKYEGREAGKRGAEMAAAYIAKEFRKLNLLAPVNGSYLQDVQLIETSMIANSFEVNNSILKPGKDFWFSGSGEAKNIQVNEITFIGNRPESELKNIEIAGKVILIILNGNSSEQISRQNYLKSKKPALIVTLNTEERNAKYSHHSAVSLSVKNGIRESLPIRENAPGIIQISEDIANLMLSRSGKTVGNLKKNNKNLTTIQLKAEIKMNYGPVQRPLKSFNILGYLEGTDLKEEVLVYSAHYDHIGLNTDGGKDKVFNGADDDGSGTSGVLAIAKAFARAKKEGHGPRRSILFLMFTGEEKNLLGSEYYSLNPVFPMSKTITNLNIDMIGRTGFDYKNSPDSANYCFLVGADRLSSDLHKISENANAVYTKMKIDYKHNAPDDQIYYWSDHYNFAKSGVPVIFYYNGKHEDYHKGSDEISKINFHLLTKRAQLAYFTGWDLANRDKRPVVDVLPVRK